MAIYQDLVLLKDAPRDLGLPISVKTLRNWRSQRLYPGLFVKVGGSVFLRKSELERIIQEQLDEQMQEARRLELAG